MNEVNYSEFMRKNGILSMISQMQIMRKEMNWRIIQKFYSLMFVNTMMLRI